MDMEVVSVALKIATHDIEFDNFVDWLRGRATGVAKGGEAYK
jgi:hypothetical protein